MAAPQSGAAQGGAPSVGAALRDARLPALESRMLVSAATGLSAAGLHAHPERLLGTDEAARLESWIGRRAAGEPMAYLLGRREFHGRDFEVSPAVLIPRPETELLVELALQRLAPQARVLDLGTGSGCIAISLACERSDLEVHALDLSDAALAVARRNAARHGATVQWWQSDWYQALPAALRFDLIVANPPYIAAGDVHLSQGDLRFEPAAALTDGADGLTALRHIIATAPGRLMAGGGLLLEHGYDQAAAVRARLRAAGFDGVRSTPDLAGIERVSGGDWPS